MTYVGQYNHSIGVRFRVMQHKKTLLAIAGFDDGRRGQWTKKWGWPLEAGKGKEVDSSVEPSEGTQHYQHIDLGPVRPILYSWTAEHNKFALF